MRSILLHVSTMVSSCRRLSYSHTESTRCRPKLSPAGQFASRVYGFERPGGVAVFTFAGRPDSTDGWEEALATFTDEGT
jgi:hypothetical protein